MSAAITTGMPHATGPPTGLQALILCGPGVSLNTFTSDPQVLPKALIPCANRPMVWYPLDWCYRMGISDVTLVTPPESAKPLEAALSTNPALTSLPSPKPIILAPRNLSQTTGTAEILRLDDVRKCVDSDFVILPCDLVSEMDGTALVQQWLTLNPSSPTQRNGGMSVFYPTQGWEGISTKKDEADFLATVPLATGRCSSLRGSLRPNVEQIVLNMPVDTLNDKIEADKGFLRLRQSLLRTHPRVKLRTRYRDAHVYIFPKWVLEFISRNEDFDSISEDVLGWWAKAGWQDGLVEKLRLNDAVENGSTTLQDSMHEDREPQNVDLVILSSTKASSSSRSQRSTSARTSVGLQVPPSAFQSSVPQLLSYVQPTPSTTSTQELIRRIDTSAQLLAVSLRLAKHTYDSDSNHALAHEHKVHPTAKLEQQARVSQEDSLVAENVRLGFRSNVKESVIGANCEIGKNVRLTRCLLMEGVVIGDGVQLTGCIVGRRAKIEGTPSAETSDKAATESGMAKKAPKTQRDDEDDKTKLVDCEVAPNFVVDAGTEAKGEKFMGFDTGADPDEAYEDENDVDVDGLTSDS